MSGCLHPTWLFNLVGPDWYSVFAGFGAGWAITLAIKLVVYAIKGRFA